MRVAEHRYKLRGLRSVLPHVRRKRRGWTVVDVQRCRAALGWYLDTPNYVENLRLRGFTDGFAGGGSGALVGSKIGSSA